MAKNHINIAPLIEKVNYGHQLRLSQGSIVNIYTTGQIVVQGKKDTGVNLLLGIR